MTMHIERTDATLGAIITGVDLADLDEPTWQRILDAWHEHALLIFPGQNLEAEAQAAFGERFGAIEYLTKDRAHKVIPISNVKPDGTLLPSDTHAVRLLRGNEGWHTDSSYMPLSAKASVLSAVMVPSAGGQTQWADMRAAYEALDDAMKERIADLAAYHSLFYSQDQIGHQAKPGAGYGFFEGEPPLRPLVKVHPVTGRPALYIGRHAYGVTDLSEQESQALLTELVEFACRPPRTHRHDWQPGDILIWDNRCVLHRACPYDPSEPRIMRHTRIAGEAATEAALNWKVTGNRQPDAVWAASA